MNIESLIEYIAGHPFVIGLFVLLIIEQVLLANPGSFPYRYGVPVKLKRAALKAQKVRNKLDASPEGLRYRVEDPGDVVYLHGTYPAGTWGPLLFVAEVRLKDQSGIVIRMAHITSLFLFVPIAGGLVRFDLYGFISALLAVVFGVWLYRRLNNALDRLVNGN